ncbi:MAG: hypothetical protein ACRDJ9_28075, partial [Dehalococcoidia bacterium]
ATAAWEPSHVLIAMGQPAELAAAAVRFTLGAEHDEATVDAAVDRIERAVQGVRETVHTRAGVV